MTGNIRIDLNKNEIRVLANLLRKHLRILDLNNNDDKRQKLQAQVNSYQRQIDQMDIDEQENRNFITILDKLELDEGYQIVKTVNYPVLKYGASDDSF